MNEAELRLGVDLPLNHGKIVFYDIGANNGDNIPYYLRKADVVVAVEANPDLCQQMRKRFISEIQQERLFIENFVLTAETQGEVVPFYLHKRHHVLSQFSPPYRINDFRRVFLPGMPVSQLIRKYGCPHYVKIDIEHYDYVVLRSLFNSKIRPNYISVESHSIEVFLLLTSLGRYNLFKIVYGYWVAEDYNKCPIETIDGEGVFSFPAHSAGPFGEDVPGSWIDSADLFRRLQSEGLGWKDIHAKKDGDGRQWWKLRSHWRIRYWLYKSKWIAWKIYRKAKHTIT